MSVQITLDPNQWIIGPITPDGVNHSHGMPLHPFNPWNFNFPLVGGSVNYVTTGFGGSLIGQSWARIEFEITGDGGITPTEGGYPNGQIHMLLFDNWVDASGRFWSPGWDLSPGHYVMTVPLDYTQWHNVIGQHNEFGFGQMLGSPTQVGITFGGDFSGHGVFDAFGVPDNFRLLDFDFLDDPTTNLTSGDDNVNFFIYDDVVRALEGNDTIRGNAGNDLIYGNQGSDLVYGNTGDDTLVGGQDHDVLFAGQGNDLVYGNLGNDIIYGNFGDDVLFGGQGHDQIFGGQGDDHIWGNLGDDTIHGNLGTDTLHLSGNRSEYTVVVGDSLVTISGPAGTDTVFNSVEFVAWDDQLVSFGGLL